MLRKLGLVDLLAAIQSKVENDTGIRCYDTVPINAASPLYYMEVIEKHPEDTKIMFCEVYTIWIHAIAGQGESSVEIYNLIDGLEESFAADIELPEPFELVLQTGQGVQSINTDESGKKRAVIVYDFKVSYGFKVKN